MEYDQVLRLLIGTRIGERLSSIQKLYADLDRAQKKFTDIFNVHCKEGCGSCCEHFYPDITNLEAEYMAFGLIFQEKDQEVLDMIRSIKEEPSSCPLYKKDSAYHCTVYGVRPLVCRLFGASVANNKEGRPVLRNCKWNPNVWNISTDELEKHEEDLVTMGSYGTQMEALQPEDTATYPLLEALERAICKIRFFIQIESDPEPEPNAS